LDIVVAGWFWPLCNHADSVQLHFNAIWCDNELDRADPLHLEFALQQLLVEACLLKLCEDEPDMFFILLKEVSADDNVVYVGYAELV
jgi:hypothetical protein